jgi:hypothetical protein
MTEVPEDRDATGAGRDHGRTPGNLLAGRLGSVSVPSFAGNFALSLAKGGVDRPTARRTDASSPITAVREVSA